MPGLRGFVSENEIVLTIANASIQDGRNSTVAEYSHPGRRPQHSRSRRSSYKKHRSSHPHYLTE